MSAGREGFTWKTLGHIRGLQEGDLRLHSLLVTAPSCRVDASLASKAESQQQRWGRKGVSVCRLGLGILAAAAKPRGLLLDCSLVGSLALKNGMEP